LCRVALALTSTALLPAAAEPWVGYSSNGQATGVLHDTGYQMNVLEAVWTEYRATCSPPDASQKLKRVHGGKKAGRLTARGASWVCNVCRSELFMLYSLYLIYARVFSGAHVWEANRPPGGWRNSRENKSACPTRAPAPVSERAPRARRRCSASGAGPAIWQGPAISAISNLYVIRATSPSALSLQAPQSQGHTSQSSHPRSTLRPVITCCNTLLQKAPIRPVTQYPIA
jgi:hypothetical protein